MSGFEFVGDDVEEPSPAADEAEVVQVRGEADGISTVSVYYEVAGRLFRARLRPSSALPEDWTTHRGEALTLTDLSEVEKPDGDRLPVVDEVAAVEWFDPSHVPPVVRGAVRRPVQIPDRPALSDE